MAETTHSEAGGHGSEEHEKHYWKVYWILLALLVVSVVGPFVGEATGVFAITLLTAFGIAFVKAALVVKNFMHLNLEPKFVAYLCATALAFMALLFFWVAPDVMRHEGQQWVNLAAMAATGESAENEAATAAGAQSSEGEAPFDPAQAFASTCGPCHGESGRGDGAAAAALDPRPADFTAPEFWAERDRARIVTAVTGGGPAVGRSPLMPAFGQQLDEEQVAALADHVLTFRPQAPAEVPVEAPAVDVEPSEGPAGEAPAAEVDETPVPEVADPPGPAAEQAPEAAPSPEPSAAETARRAAFITRRLYR